MRKLSEEEIRALKVLVFLLQVMNTKISDAFLKYGKKKKSLSILMKNCFHGF